MGALLSTVGTNGATIVLGLGDIPEGCVACVFLYLTPLEICYLACQRYSRGAASVDSVWEAKLPSNYQDLLDLMPPERYRNLSKKYIFALLSRPVPFGDGNKVCALPVTLHHNICVLVSFDFGTRVLHHAVRLRIKWFSRCN
ncbi:hypothetical protein K1719_005883 [Acacia pycnantha]|nr:hypothetical protein K1719_005883 [Acacia pycnantha]